MKKRNELTGLHAIDKGIVLLSNLHVNHMTKTSKDHWTPTRLTIDHDISERYTASRNDRAHMWVRGHSPF